MLTDKRVVDLEEPLMIMGPSSKYEGGEPKEKKKNKKDKKDKPKNKPRIDVNAQPAFMKKALTITGIQLIVTILIVAFMQMKKFDDKGKKSEFYISMMKNKWILWVSIALFVVCSILLVFKGHAKDKKWYTYVEVVLFTLSIAFMAGYIALMAQPKIVLFAFVLTLGDVLAVWLYIKRNESNYEEINKSWLNCHKTTYDLGFVVALTLLFFMSQQWTFSWGPIWCSIFAFLFSFYIYLDLRLIVNGAYPGVSQDGEVWAACKLYVDVIGIFMVIASTMGEKDSDE